MKLDAEVALQVLHQRRNGLTGVHLLVVQPVQRGAMVVELAVVKGVQFGTEIGTKAADIIVYTDATKLTPKIIVECKKPKRKDGIEQLKSYMNAKGAPVAVWSNGTDSIIAGCGASVMTFCTTGKVAATSLSGASKISSSCT